MSDSPAFFLYLRSLGFLEDSSTPGVFTKSGKIVDLRDVSRDIVFASNCAARVNAVFPGMIKNLADSLGAFLETLPETAAVEAPPAPKPEEPAPILTPQDAADAPAMQADEPNLEADEEEADEDFEVAVEPAPEADLTRGLTLAEKSDYLESKGWTRTGHIWKKGSNNLLHPIVQGLAHNAAQFAEYVSQQDA